MSHSPFAPSSKPSGVNEAVEPSSSDSTDKDGAFNVRRSFRSFASALIVAARQAEKVAAASGSDTLATDKTTKETVDMILKQRQSVCPVDYIEIVLQQQ